MNNSLFTNALIQSKYLYVQAAGSTGSDGSVSGIHLRWDLMNELGDKHIPKGTLSSTQNGFNRANDKVQLFRTTYAEKFPIIIDFALQVPSIIVDSSNSLDNSLGLSSGGDRLWIYKQTVQGVAVTVYIRFVETARYDAISINPSTDSIGFIQAYGSGLIEAWVKNMPLFAASVYVSGWQSNYPVLRMESLTRVDDAEEDIQRILSGRKTIQGDRWQTPREENLLLQEIGDELLQENQYAIALEQDAVEVGAGMFYKYGRLQTENIEKIRFAVERGYVSKIEFEPYELYIKGVNAINGWTSMGEFGLTTDTTEAYNRLEKTAGSVDGNWLRYKGQTVHVQNYKNRWNGGTNAIPGLRTGIEQYIALSEGGENQKTYDEETGAAFSYFDMLKMVSYDYHIARMLGLGYIDDSVTEENEEYVYVAVYVSGGILPEGSGISHFYATEPIRKSQEKLPKAPYMRPVDYGMIQGKGTNAEIELTKAGGYSYDNACRFVNLYAEDEYPYEEAGAFFASSEDFILDGETDSVFAGIEYRAANGANWQNLLYSDDTDYCDASADAEVSVAPITSEEKPLYTHKETESGMHQYRVYGINWFSRTSPYSNVAETDETSFVKRNTLLPPINLQAQIIQRESPLLLTTAGEQAMLSAIQGDDKTLVRVTFAYTNLHDTAYQYADKVQLLFRKEAQQFVQGAVKSVEYDEAHPETFVIRTKIYSYLDIDGNEVQYAPTVSAENLSRYAGGVITIQKDMFLVEQIVQSEVDGEGVVITVRNNETLAATDVTTEEGIVSPTFAAAKTFEIPQGFVGVRFTMRENISNAENWRVEDREGANILQMQVQLSGSDWTEHTERIAPSRYNRGTMVPGSLTDDEVYDEKTRGIWDEATVSAYEIDGVQQQGLYVVEMNTKTLLPHPQQNAANSVKWDKGIVRIHTVSDIYGLRRELDVVRILSSESEHIRLLVSDENEDTETIQTGTSVSVNYYPAYKMYVYVDELASFTEAVLLPEADEIKRRTYIAVRAVDNEFNYPSLLSKAAAITALEYVEALPPEMPQGGTYATRPDYFGKSTYRFTMQCRHRPYSIVFMRASERMILEALYEPETIVQIRTELAALGDDEFFTDRWQNLIDFDYVYDNAAGKYYDVSGANANGAFRKFPAADGYRFPKPDRRTDVNGNSLFTGEQEPGAVLDKVKEAVTSCFLPLTEQPLIYSFISSNSAYVPTNQKQHVRDVHGNMLSPNDPEFVQAPMAKIVDTNRHIVQFTDFTLDGAARNSYFYYGIEINNTMCFSAPGPICGPIQLVDTSAPQAPQIVSVRSQLYDEYSETPTAVFLTVQNAFGNDTIARLDVYRALRASDAVSIRSMQKITEVDLQTLEIADGANIEIADMFTQEGEIPYGEPLLYRVIALRKIHYADAEGTVVEDYVPSKPSNLVMTNVIDVGYPTAPDLHFAYNEEESSETELVGGVLSWSKAVYNGTYYVYKMNDSGNWVLLDTIQSNDASMSYTQEGALQKVDEDGETVYHRYKVEVENTAGLRSTNDNTIVI